jgi:ankyrin repeat protein
MSNAEAFFESVRSNDFAKIGALLRSDPALANARCRGDATLLNGKVFKDKKPVDMAPDDKRDATALHFAAFTGNAALAKLLIDHGAYVNVIGYENNHDMTPPIVLAAWEGGIDVMRVLLEHSANPNTISSNGVTPLGTAIRHGKQDRVDLLKQFGAKDDPFARLMATKYNPDREDEAIAILQEHPEIAKEEWRGPSDNGRPFVTGSTALHYAANDGKIRLMKLLIEHGADVNAWKSTWYAVPLAWAANNARLEAINLLLDHGADVNGPNVLHAAAYGGSSCGQDETKPYIEAIKLLIARGANINSRRYYKEMTPLAVAIDSGNEKAADYLRSLGALET